MELQQFEIIRTKIANLNSEIEKQVTCNFITNNFSQLELRYITSANFLFKSYLFYAVITSLRFSDLYELELSKINKTKSLLLIQHKTKRTKAINFFFLNNELVKATHAIVSFKSLFNYEQLRKEIKRLNLLLQRNNQLNYCNKSHLFRHLRATHLNNSNASPRAIAEQLGHMDLESQKWYIHGGS